MVRWITYAQKQMVYFIPAALILGFVFGWMADASVLQPWVLPLTFLMVYPGMVGLNYSQVLNGGDFRLQIVTQAFNFMVMPALAYGLGLWLFPDDAMLRLGLFMIALLPTSGMTLTWT